MRILIALAATLLIVVAAAPASAVPVRPSIVGGVAAPAGAWPSIVFLQFDPTPAREGSGDEWFCGGSVVGTRTILTAAHCVLSDTVTVEPSSIAMAVNRLTISDPTQGIVLYGDQVLRIGVHPSYDRFRGSDGGPYDAAVIQTTVDLPAPAARLATVADAPFYAAGATASIAGWGLTATKGDSSDTLLQAQVPIVGDAECAALDEITVAEAALMVCAGYPQGGVDTCQGDSGGPLTVLGADGLPTLAGLVSWGYDCAAPGRPGLYTRVATIVDQVNLLIADDPATWATWADAVRPRVVARSASATRGKRVSLRYRVTGETGRTQEQATVSRTRNGKALKTITSRFAVNPVGQDSYLSWRVPRTFAAGRYWWCVTSADANGNASMRKCARLTVR